MGKDFINTLVPQNIKSWDIWQRFYNEIIRIASIIKKNNLYNTSPS